MSNNNNHIDDSLLMLYITGEATNSQSAEVEEWLKLNAKNQKYFDQLQDVWVKSLTIKAEPVNVDVDRAWDKVSDKISEPEPQRTSYDKPNHFITLSKYFYRFAAAIFIGLILFKIISSFFNTTDKLILASNDAIIYDTLSDNSIVSLNKNSKLYYPENFSDDSRKVSLEGEAFFKISPDPDKPFIIQAGEAYIKVLGTSFNINAYKDSSRYKVTVVTGKVSFFTLDENNDTISIILHKNEEGIFNVKDKSFKKLNNIDKNEFYWNSKTLIFEKTELFKVFELLENIFKVKIKVKDEKINTLLLSATFKENNIEEILNIISASFNLRVKKENKSYLIDSINSDVE